METKLNEITVKLSRDQKEEILYSFLNREEITLYLKHDALYGNDTLLVPEKSFEWDMFEEFVSGKETPPKSSALYGFYKMLCKETYSEMVDNGFKLVPSMNDKGLGNFRLYTPPTVIERLEEARKHNTICFNFSLDYSLLNNSTCSIKFNVFKNVVKMIENILNM